jgi:hypothetical protein
MSLPFEGTLALRRRGSWEAADAGLLLWRANFIYFLPFFALPCWICAFGFRMVPEYLRPWSWLALWFLKPLFDRPVLHVLSVRFFEKDAGAARLLRGLGKNIFRGLPGDLLWRRFSPFRSAIMPLRMLENLKAGETRRRKRDLAKGGLYFCVFLTIWGIILEVVLLGGEILFSFIMLDIVVEDYFSSFSDFFSRSEIFIFAAWCLNYILVESVYVCMGFGLYINSRVEVEGWDIEILFKKFAEARKKKTTLAGILFFCVVAGCLLPARADAEESRPALEEMDYSGMNTEETDRTVPLETLRKIFASGDFGGFQGGWELRPKDRKEESNPFQFNFDPWFNFAPWLNIAPWLETIRQAVAFMLRLVLILCAGGLGVFFIRRFYKYRGGKAAVQDGYAISSRFHSLGESPESLLERARRFYDQGEIRQAWGCCLAALLESWSRYRAFKFPPDATEYECLALVRAAGVSGGATDFAAFVNRWTALAYGGRLPPEGSFEEALALCWSLIPDPARETSAAAPSGNTAEARDV